MIYAFEGPMREGMSLSTLKCEIYEARMGQGMCLSSLGFLWGYLGLEITRDRNRRVICDFNPCKKYKNFDQKQFLKELDRLEAK